MNDASHVFEFIAFVVVLIDFSKIFVEGVPLCIGREFQAGDQLLQIVADAFVFVEEVSLLALEDGA